jgi:pyridinium-3,5-biscarboxylic acid mononucleotide sulfurtransferase
VIDDPRYARLLETFRPRGRVLTAYSGGVDSTLVAAAALDALGRDGAPVALGDSPSLPRRELAAAIKLAESLGLVLHVVRPGEQDDPGYQQNAGDRCFHCKTHLYATMHDLADRLGIAYLANGTNVDDLGDHRPGLHAARNAEVIAPLVEAGLSKQDVRELAGMRGLPNADKPAAACLASRLPYGTEVTPQRLAQVEAAEDALADLGYTGFRVRHEGNTARLEVPWEQARAVFADDLRRAAVVEAVKRAGYAFVALDLEGYRTGSGNVVLKGPLAAGR